MVLILKSDGSDLERKINDVDKKIPDVSGLVKKTDFNTKVTEVECKIPSISGLATSSALAAVENKIPNVSGLVKMTDFEAKFKKISDRVASTKTKHLLVENELKKFKNLIYLISEAKSILVLMACKIT